MMNFITKPLFALLITILFTASAYANGMNFISENSSFSLEGSSDTNTYNAIQKMHRPPETLHLSNQRFETSHAITLGSIIWKHTPFNPGYKQSKVSDINLTTVTVPLISLLFAPLILLIIYIKRFFKNMSSKPKSRLQYLVTT